MVSQTPRSNAQPQTAEAKNDAFSIKYKKMKRNLIILHARQNEAQAALDAANRRIQNLERKLRQKQKKSTITTLSRTISSASLSRDDPMETSQVEDETKDNIDDKEMELDDEEDELEDDDDMEDEEEEEDELEEDEDDAVEPVPKRQQQRTSRRKRVVVPRDENGNIQLPFQIASLNVLDLGKIEWKRPLYHNERYIFPIGYTAEKLYMSMVDPTKQTTYTCKVEDGGDGPLFTLKAADAPDIELSARTATGVWALVIKKANEVRQKESANAISGPEYYGFAHPLVIEMIESLDGVDKCERYTRRHRD